MTVPYKSQNSDSQRTRKIKVERYIKGDNFTVGKLYIDDVFYCNTLEDKDRGLRQDMPLATINSIKVPAKTCIPSGTYKISLDIKSPSFSQKDWYVKNINGGRLPYLLNVPGYTHILLHGGKTVDNTEGCLLTGIYANNGQLKDYASSRQKLKDVFDAIKNYKDIEITIKRTYNV
jgi:hypothetical protein